MVRIIRIVVGSIFILIFVGCVLDGGDSLSCLSKGPCIVFPDPKVEIVIGFLCYVIGIIIFFARERKSPVSDSSILFLPSLLISVLAVVAVIIVLLTDFIPK